MEFLDMNLTKGSSCLLHTIQVPSGGGFLQKTMLFSGFKLHTQKKFALQGTSSLHE
jgi:hypothetical protein